MECTQISPAPVAAGNGAMQAGNLAQNYTTATPEAATCGAAARQYVEAGLALVPLHPGTKKAKGCGWNKPGAAITDSGRAEGITGGVGVHHLVSRTCAVDVDDWHKAARWCAERGIDLAALFMAGDAVQIQSGRDNRGKLIFRLPDSLDWLPHLNVADGGLELRCANGPNQSQQDVLPPSVHPDTGKPYQWRGDWQAIPTLPAEVLAAWLAQSGHTPSDKPPVDATQAADSPQPSPGATIAHVDAPKGTRELFERRTPKRPYACDDFSRGLHSMPAADAMGRRNIQINTHSFCGWLATDNDTPNGAKAWELAGLPEPAWVAENPVNGHAHTVYGIQIPVAMLNPDSPEALRLLAAVQSAYIAAMQGDVAYSGLISKNPFHPCWRTYFGREGVYTLREMAGYVDLNAHRPYRGVKAEEIGLGRNCTLFAHVRQFAYARVRHYQGKVDGLPEWQGVVHAEAMRRNCDFQHPLHRSETWQVAKSVAGWTFKKFDVAASDRRFSQRQAKRGTRKGQSKRDALLPVALELRAEGLSQNQIAEQLGIGQPTLCRWLKGYAKP